MTLYSLYSIIEHEVKSALTHPATRGPGAVGVSGVKLRGGAREPLLQPDCPAGALGALSGAARRARGRGGASGQIPMKPSESRTPGTPTVTSWLSHQRVCVCVCVYVPPVKYLTPQRAIFLG
ncbi:hypothetical protein EYF80_066384 [Liparis tanakae]|uniref:Uncharacterized protein n=1 Tax=Liparis tanakae TaxID=230148 RepID=A0A4Z2E3Y6_9TELE|nr:hypothetical protein EYF80_066384 [Liparis tanakae]